MSVVAENASSALSRMGIDFDAVCHAHVPLMVGMAVERFKISQMDAQTLAHQIFLVYFLKPDDIRDLRAWFVGAMSNACWHYLRTRARDVTLPPEIVNQPDPEFPADRLPNHLAARQAFRCLTSRCTLALQLHYRRGLQHRGDRSAAPHHPVVRKEARVAMPATGAGALQMMTLETKEGLFALMEQIAAEREAARPIVEKLVASGESMEEIEIPDGWRTAGMVMELADTAYAKNESRPKQSLALAHLSFALCRSISESIYPSIVDAYLRGRTWKEIGFAQRYLCAYGPAAEAFERAEVALSADALFYEAATAMFARATIYYLAYEDHRSTTLTAKIRQIFQAVGDQRRLSMCEILEGITSVRRGDLETGRMNLEAALRSLLQSEESAHDRYCLQQLGICLSRLRQDERFLVSAPPRSRDLRSAWHSVGNQSRRLEYRKRDV